MSRAKASNTVSPLSLFPFIGVLLCTMGALLVVLVAVSRQAKVQAQHRVEAAQAATPTEPTRDIKSEQMNEVHRYVTRVSQVRTDVEKKLRDDQLRLSHLEEHMRRLQDQMMALRKAGEELIAMEGEHYDDRQQAEREVERLQQLITDTRQAITSIKAEGNGKKKSYALIPYEGPNGTYRRPIYVECKHNRVTLQPEGLELGPEDFQPPLGPGNPLAAVLRAARSYLIQRDQNNFQTRDTEPYPLVLVRPDGALMYAHVQRAIEAGDFDFGFELVEEDWKLKFPSVDPHLASIEQQALEHARMRQQLLAEAAPRAYRRSGGGARGQYEFDEAPDDGFAGGGNGAPTGGVRMRKSQGRGGSRSEDESGTEEAGGYADAGGGGGGAGEYASAGGGRQGGDRYASREYGDDVSGGGGGGGTGGPLRAPAGGDPGEGTGQGGGSSDGGGQSGPGGSSQLGSAPHGMAAGNGGGGGGGPVPGGAPYGSTSPMGGTSPGINMQVGGQPGGMSSGGAGMGMPGMDPQGADRQIGASSPDPDAPKYLSPHDRPAPAKVRGKDWAIKKNGQSVPVRRTIQVVVRQNQLGVLSDEADPKARGKRNKTIPVTGDTVESLDSFVKAVHEQIESWGMAGDGLYWKPVLVLNIGPDGQQRAADLTRLLKDSGLDVRNAATAKLESQGSSSATR